MLAFGFELPPESFNAFISGHTQKLDELNKLQGRIFMGLAQIEAHKVVQSLNNLQNNPPKWFLSTKLNQ